MRIDRKPDEKRATRVTDNYLMSPAGSVLIETGNTKVICTASVENSTARHLTGTGKGWVTAEYGMLPGSTGTRKKRDKNTFPVLFDIYITNYAKPIIPKYDI